MTALTAREDAALRASGCTVIAGNDMPILMEQARATKGPVLLVETRPPVLGPRGYVLETTSYGFASLIDGVLISYIGFSLARHQSAHHMQDERTRKWALKTVVRALWRESDV